MLLEKLFRKKQSSLRAVAAAVLTDKHRVEDVVQEAFARVLRVRRSFQSDLEALNYLKKTIYHTAIDSYRRIQQERRRTSETREGCVGYRSQQTFPDPLERMIEEQESDVRDRLIREMHRGLELLDVREQEAIQIFFSQKETKKLKDICREKQIPYSTLRSRMLAGVDKLRRHMRRQKMPGFEGSKDALR